jgi:hypothetical protein
VCVRETILVHFDKILSMNVHLKLFVELRDLVSTVMNIRIPQDAGIS